MTIQHDDRPLAYRVTRGPDGRLFIEAHYGEQEPLPNVVIQFEQVGDEIKFVDCQFEDN